MLAHFAILCERVWPALPLGAGMVLPLAYQTWDSHRGQEKVLLLAHQTLGLTGAKPKMMLFVPLLLYLTNFHSAVSMCSKCRRWHISFGTM